MLVELNCLNCGKPFLVKPRRKATAKYCSISCYNDHKRYKINRVCPICGKEFQVHPYRVKNGQGVFCSTKCHDHHRMKRVKKNCEICGKPFVPRFGQLKAGWGRFCSKECMGLGNRGGLHHNWKGGISFAPYCPKFNDEFKERVRNFFNRTCMICGKPEHENNVKLSVHHVNYEKMVCCDNTPPLFLPLCRSCHSKTNYNRNVWEKILTEYIMTHFDGESYLPEDGTGQ